MFVVWFFHTAQPSHFKEKLPENKNVENSSNKKVTSKIKHYPFGTTKYGEEEKQNVEIPKFTNEHSNEKSSKNKKHKKRNRNDMAGENSKPKIKSEEKKLKQENKDGPVLVIEITHTIVDVRLGDTESKTVLL